jgi:hypothetical protein
MKRRAETINIIEGLKNKVGGGGGVHTKSPEKRSEELLDED